MDFPQMSQMMEVLILVALCASAVLYFVPSILASKRRVELRGWLLFVNICLGWTLLGWGGCLAWALLGRPEAPNPYTGEVLRAMRERELHEQGIPGEGRAGRIEPLWSTQRHE